MMGDPISLELALAGLTDSRAQSIRAMASEVAGDHQDALAQEMRVPGAEPDPALAWRAGAWALLESADDPLLQSASRAVLTSEAAAPQKISLAESQSLLADAEAARALTQDLLTRFALPPDEAAPMP